MTTVVDVRRQKVNCSACKAPSAPLFKWGNKSNYIINRRFKCIMLMFSISLPKKDTQNFCMNACQDTVN